MDTSKIVNPVRKKALPFWQGRENIASAGNAPHELSNWVYSINIEDVQNVAEEELGRKLTNKELKIIEDKIGDYIDWYGAIDMAIQSEILH